jgi:3-oxoacyl-[acyl-carrier-protein] synthase III
MLFQDLRIAASAWELPEEVVRSEELEQRLAPLYQRLGLSAGRLELMTGIRERRFWPRGARPSAAAAAAGEKALAASGLERGDIGCLIHAAVSRDFLEPATASVVHHALGLSEGCMAFDLSNACLGFANALANAGALIERGAIRAALVVAAEDGRPLVEATLGALGANGAATKRDLKLAFASLTIGSGAAAMVVTSSELAPHAPRIVASTSGAATEHHVLCHGDQAPGHAGPLMTTDSEAMLHAGNELLARTWARFLDETGWSAASVDRVVTHQVGVQHRRLVLSTLGLPLERDFPTVETLGNIGSVSLPLTFARAREAGFLEPGQRVAMLGIGSGLQCQILGVEV